MPLQPEKLGRAVDKENRNLYSLKFRTFRLRAGNTGYCLFEKEKRLKIFKCNKHLLWRKAKRRGFLRKITLKRLGQINQIRFVLLT